MGEKEILVSEQVLQVPFCYSAGRTASRFFMALRDEQAIYGIRCPKCGKVYAPARTFCGNCFARNSDWVKLSGEGVIETFTEVNYPESVQPRPAPYIIGIIRLDGADTGLVHLIQSAREIKIGQRVRAVFSRERKGHLLDLSHFEPIV